MGAINSHTMTNTVRLPPHASRHQQCCRRHHLPYIENTVKTSHMCLTSTVLWAPTIVLYLTAWATRLSSIRTLSLSLVRPSPSSRKGDVLSPNKGKNQSTTTRTTHTIQMTKDPNEQQTFEHLAHSAALVTLGLSDQSPTGPLPSVCNSTANFEHLGLGIKSPTDSNWT